MADVAVIGAGISGLSCAWTLKKLGLDVVVLEAGDRAGGVIRTETIRGYQIEWGPNSIQPNPAALKLIDEAGLWDELLPPEPNIPRFIYAGGRLRRIPFGPLTFGGIARAFREPFIRSKSPIDESVADFFIRRFGQQAHDRLVAPALTGIFATDTKLLSIAAVLPRILEMERANGSLTAAMLRSFTRRSTPNASTKPRPKGFTFSFPKGIETLPSRLAQTLEIRYQQNPIPLDSAPATVLTIPAYRAASLLENKHPALSNLMKNIRYSPIIVTATCLPEHSFSRPLRGFGFLVPRNEGLHLLGSVFSSAVFPGRAPDGHVLLTSFIGGSFEPEALDWPDSRVWEVVCPELKQVLKTDAMPEPIALVRHRNALPQYNIGHERWVEAVKNELQNTPGLFITANYMEGASVPSCIDQGNRMAYTVAEYLGRKA